MAMIEACDDLQNNCEKGYWPCAKVVGRYANPDMDLDPGRVLQIYMDESDYGE